MSPTARTILRPRGATGRRRHRRRGAALRLGPAFQAGAPALAAAGAGPYLGMPEPEDRRTALVSGGISLLAHAGIFGALLLSAWLAPRVVDEVIPVQILKDLPGSEAEPAPAAPKTLAPRRPVFSTALAPRVVPKVAAANPAVQQVSAEALRMAQLNAAAAPTDIQRRDVTAQRIDARTAAAVPRASGVVMGQVSPVKVAASGYAGPLAVGGPRAVAQGQAVDVTAPQAFANYAAVAVEDVAPAATGAAAAVVVPGADAGGFAIDTDVSEDWGAGGGSGGEGFAVGAARCTESSFVHRYYEVVKDRTYARWALPDDTPADAQVVLRFVLDESGSASKVEFLEASDDALGRSAMDALRAASPFPTMDDNVRCLAGKRLKATFRVPAT